MCAESAYPIAITLRVAASTASSTSLWERPVWKYTSANMNRYPWLSASTGIEPMLPMKAGGV